MLYRLLYVIGQLAIHQYFRSIQHLGAPPVERGPVVIVANHFNGLLDALLVAGSFWRRVWVTGKSSLFDGWSGRLLAFLPAIPIYRPGEADPTRNADTFRHTSRVLASGGAIVVFPYEFPTEFQAGERKLHKFKTGAIRMALAAEEAAGRDLGVRIQPVGINYAQFCEVGTSVTLVFGQPLRARDYLTPEDSFAGVRACAAELDGQMRRLVVEIPAEGYAELSELVAQLFSVERTDDYALLSIVARKVRELAPLHPELARRLGPRIERYLSLCEALDLPPGTENLPLAHRWRIVLAAPITLTGWLVHLVPNVLLGAWARRLTSDPYYQGTVRFLLGFVGFPLWYLALGLVLLAVLPSPTWVLAVVGLVALSGIVVNKFGYRLNLLLTLMLPGRRRRHLARLREEGQALRQSLRTLAELPPTPEAVAPESTPA